MQVVLQIYVCPGMASKGHHAGQCMKGGGNLETTCLVYTPEAGTSCEEAQERLFDRVMCIGSCAAQVLQDLCGHYVFCFWKFDVPLASAGLKAAL